MSEVVEPSATPRNPNTLLLATRGHDMLPNGDLKLGESTLARVATAAAYFTANYDQFDAAQQTGEGGYIVVSGGYATLATGRRIPPPPERLREASLAEQLIIDEYEVPPRFVKKCINSTTTLEVVLEPWEQGYFKNISVGNPLGPVTQASQGPRLRWYFRKLSRLPEKAIFSIFAPGEDDPAIHKDEARLLLAARVFTWGTGPRALRRGQRILDLTSQAVLATGLVKPPAEKYLSI